VKKAFNELEKAVMRDDIDLLINGYDIGREGEPFLRIFKNLESPKKRLPACGHLP
jgi:hypothetical protein